MLNNDRSNRIETNSGQITFIVTSLLWPMAWHKICKRINQVHKKKYFWSAFAIDVFDGLSWALLSFYVFKLKNLYRIRKKYLYNTFLPYCIVISIQVITWRKSHRKSKKVPSPLENWIKPEKPVLTLLNQWTYSIAMKNSKYKEDSSGRTRVQFTPITLEFWNL